MIRDNEKFYKTYGNVLGSEYFDLAETEDIFNENSDNKIKLRQIIAVQDFEVFNHENNEIVKIKKGTLGGFVEFRESLVNGTWINEKTVVYGKSYISHAYVEDSIIKNTHLCNSFAKDCFISDGKVEDSRLFKSIIKNSKIHKVLNLDDCILDNSDLKQISNAVNSNFYESKISETYIKNSSLNQVNICAKFSSVVDSTINTFEFDERVTFNKSFINGLGTCHCFKRVGIFNESMVIHCNNDGEYQISFAGNCKKVYNFETELYRNNPFSNHTKSIFKLIDFVQLITGFECKRLGVFDKTSIRIKSFFNTFSISGFSVY